TRASRLSHSLARARIRWRGSPTGSLWFWGQLSCFQPVPVLAQMAYGDWSLPTIELATARRRPSSVSMRLALETSGDGVVLRATHLSPTSRHAMTGITTEVRGP